MTTKIGAVDVNLASKPSLGGLVRHRLAQLVHQDEGGLVLDIEIAAELHGRQALRGVYEQTDRAEQINEGELVRGEDRARGGAELIGARRAFEWAARLKIIGIEAAASRADRRTIRLRPAQSTKSPIGLLLAAGSRCGWSCNSTRWHTSIPSGGASAPSKPSQRLAGFLKIGPMNGR